MRALALLIVPVVACSHARPATAPADHAELAAHAPVAPPADAAVTPADAPAPAPDAAAPPAAFESPPPLPPPGPPTPSSRHCRSTPDQDADREAAREAAALDAALRAQGLTPLEVQDSGMNRATSGRRKPSGKPIALGGGRYGLVVGEIAGCGGQPPVAAMTAGHEVFVVEPEIVARHTRSVLECSSTCRGACGMEMPPHDAIAIVPGDARLGPPRTIRVPLEVQVTFRYLKSPSCNVP